MNSMCILNKSYDFMLIICQRLILRVRVTSGKYKQASQRQIKCLILKIYFTEKKIYSCCTVECVQSILKLGKINTCILSESILRCWRLVGRSDRSWPHWEFSAWGFYCLFYKTAIRKRLSRFPMASAALQTNHFRCKQKCYANGVSFRGYRLLMLVSSQPTWFQS